MQDSISSLPSCRTRYCDDLCSWGGIDGGSPHCSCERERRKLSEGRVGIFFEKKINLDRTVLTGVDRFRMANKKDGSQAVEERGKAQIETLHEAVETIFQGQVVAVVGLRALGAMVFEERKATGA